MGAESEVGIVTRACTGAVAATQLTVWGVMLVMAGATGPYAAPYQEPSGYKEHPIRAGDGQGGWVLTGGECQFLHYTASDRLMPFGLAAMDNGEVLFLGSAEAPGVFQPVVAISTDQGETWGDLVPVPDSSGRPMMLSYLGGGTLCFQAAAGATASVARIYSHDYGRTWPERVPIPDGIGGGWNVEGSPLLDRDETGAVTRMAEIGYTSEVTGAWPAAYEGHLRWSADQGRTWTDETKPAAWSIDMEHNGVVHRRGVSEGSITRAANGTLIAALRVDMPPRYYVDGQAGVHFDDSLEGLAISLSHDDGKTWSPMKVLFEAGRHHPHLLRLPDGRIVMTYIVRDDVREGRLASYRRGCEALISSDNGETWDTSRRIVLDEFEYYDGSKWFNGETGHLYSALLPDGRVLTAYGMYLSKGACLIRWRP